MAKCTYCKCQIPEGRALEVCDRCGVSVWGPKMFKAIQGGMEEARVKGDLDQGGNGNE